MKNPWQLRVLRSFGYRVDLNFRNRNTCAGTEILDESDGDGAFTNEYVFFGGKRVAMRVVSSGNIYYYEDDMLGSARIKWGLPGRRRVEPGGSVQAGATSLREVHPERSRRNADFYPFGGERDITTTCGSNYKFEGKERDTETGNDDFGARYYTSRLGRWLSADWSSVPAPVPYANLTNPQTLNLYAMVSDNPETFADLDGHLTEEGPYNLEGGDWADVPQGIDSDSNDAKAKKKKKGKKDQDGHLQCTNATCTTATITVTVKATAPKTARSMGAAGVATLAGSSGIELGPGDLLIVVGALMIYEAAVHWGAIRHVLFSKGGRQNILPSWAEGERPLPGESASDFAKRLCDRRYGPGNYDTGPTSEFSKIRKWVRDKFGN